MFDEIISIENLLAAWRAFRAGKLGNNYVQQTWRYFEDVIFGLHDDLRTKEYRHSPYVRTPIQDPKPRIIHVSTVRDRIVHHALHRVLLPMFEQSFISDSYSCRIGRGTHAAVKRLETFVRKVSRNNTRVCWALKCDIAKYFNNVDHTILLALLQKKVRCPNTMWLIREIVTSFPPVDNFFERERERERVKGIPLGNLTSQLFANVYMNPFDHFVKEELRVKQYLRFTDDFVLLHHDPVQLVSLLPVLRRFLRERLALELHPRKVSLRKFRQGIDFLGYVSLPHHRALRTRTKRRMFRQVQISDEKHTARLQSYLGVVQHADARRLRQWLLGLLQS